ncbi:hypothetical protein CcI6DRAFT_01525 [Frankia sp. CcI6]|nr:hypothetical protein CcI6DRAFT_01525 [Frankia sp. CcI6]KFB05754.1 hypothetical protein ALLO2DRAFT_01390 [Frankia sp. Allo2]OAA30334.1 hypothetical protein AAY23_1010138 [Frankia casuarinae]OHV57712.1 hypothetical protein CgIS1_00775 [Frankia sp. CgIS1]
MQDIRQTPTPWSRGRNAMTGTGRVSGGHNAPGYLQRRVLFMAVPHLFLHRDRVTDLSRVVSAACTGRA